MELSYSQQISVTGITKFYWELLAHRYVRTYIGTYISPKQFIRKFYWELFTYIFLRTYVRTYISPNFFW